MFKLSDHFMSQYRGKQPEWGYGDLSYFVYKRTYAREKENGQQEEYWETCQRVVEGVFNIQHKHCMQMGLEWVPQKAQATAQKMFQKMWEFKFLPPGRGLWLMGTPVVEKIGSAGLNNCFSGDTKFITEKGATRLADCVDQKVWVLNEEHCWEEAFVRSYGDQRLQRVTMRPFGLRSNHRIEYRVTSDHRWILSDGTQTTTLQVGDRVRSNTAKVHEDEAYQLGLVHGVVFGDGTRHTYYPDRFMIRLCDQKNRRLQGALEGHKGYVSTTAVQSDPFVTLRSSYDLKALPSAHHLGQVNHPPSYLQGFLRGWLEADGHIGMAKHYMSFTLDTIRVDAVEWLMDHAPMLGISILGYNLESSPTNFGERNAPLHRVTFKFGDAEYIVESIEEDVSEEVFCVEAPETHTFTLAGGILTGNCGFISTKDIHRDFAFPFCWTADMMMLGVGVGFDTKGAGKLEVHKPNGDGFFFDIPDTREGWVKALWHLLSSYAKPDQSHVKFGYGKIRKAGEPIRGFGGIACGPEPLKRGLESIRQLLDARVGQTLTSVDITDIMNFVGKFVVSGNVRRGAEIAIGEEWDQDFIEMKNPERFGTELADRRWASNNSIFVTPDSSFEDAVKSIAKNGEPGLIFLGNARHYGRFKDGWRAETSSRFDDIDGFNPCAEQGLKHGELCCLVETFPANHESSEEYYETLKFAFMYAKTVTLIPTHNQLTNQVMLSNRRIGLSMSGIQQALKKFGSAEFFGEFCDKGYDVVRHWDRIYSRWLGIPTSIKVTTVKPSGTVSLLAGATPGVHCTHSKYYYRTFRVAAVHPLVKKLLAAGYRIEFAHNDQLQYDEAAKNTKCKTSWDDAKTEWILESSALLEEFGRLGGSLVVYFPVQEKNFTKSKFDISLWEQLCLAREMQEKWSDNSVSITVTFTEDEIKDLKSAIEYHAPYVKTLSFLPLQDHQYAQAPYQECTQEEFEAYDNRLKKLRLTSLRGGKAQGERYCNNDSCSI